MRDFSNKQFNSNTPMKNYIKLQQQIDSLQTRIRSLEQQVIELVVENANQTTH